MAEDVLGIEGPQTAEQLNAAAILAEAEAEEKAKLDAEKGEAGTPGGAAPVATPATQVPAVPAEPSEPETIPFHRFKEQTAKRREAEELAAYWRGRAEGTIAQSPAEPPAPEPVEEPEPKEADFPNYADYNAAHLAWQGRKILKNAEQIAQEIADKKVSEALRQHNERTQAETRAQSQVAMVQKIAESDSEFAESAQTLGQFFQPGMGAFDALFASEKFAEVVKYLGKNIETAKAIALMPAEAQKRAVFEINGHFKFNGSAPAAVPVAKPSPVRTVSAAPAPPKSTVGGNSPSAVDEDAMSTDDWMKKRNSEVVKKAKMEQVAWKR